MKKLFIYTLFVYAISFATLFAADFQGGSGTSSDPYRLANINHWNNLYDSVRIIPHWSNGKYFQLTASIWIPVTNWLHTLAPSVLDTMYYFAGNFNGLNHTITVNINAGTYEAESGVALFGRVRGATIKNLKVEGSITATASACVAGIVSTTYVNEMNYIDSCSNYATITGGLDTVYNDTGRNVRGGGIGGICGYGNYITITNCKNFGNIKGKYNVGGICGLMRSNTAISQCLNVGHILADSAGAGGIVGDAPYLNHVPFRYNMNAGVVLVGCTKYPEVGYAGGIASNVVGNMDTSLSVGRIEQIVSQSYGTIGSISGTYSYNPTYLASNNFYDKQMSKIGGINGADVAGRAEGRLTKNLVGNALKSVWGNNTAIIYEDSLYPRFGNDTTHIISAIPIFLYVSKDGSHYDTYDNITRCFKVINKYGVQWSSKQHKILFNGNTATPIQGFEDTIVAKIGSIYIKEIPVYITSALRDCYDSVYLDLPTNIQNVGYTEGSGLYYNDDRVTIKAVVTDSCYSFKHWIDEKGNIITPKKEFTIRITDVDTTITAVFEINKYELTLQSYPYGAGTLTPNSTEYNCGSSIELNVKENECYKFLYWYDVGADTILSNKPKCNVIIDNDNRFTAYFQGPELHLHSVPAVGGLVNGDTYFEFLYGCGTAIGVVATPNPEWYFKHWVDSATGKVVSTDSLYQFTINKFLTLNAIFESIYVRYDLILKTRPDNNIAIVNGAGNYEENRIVDISTEASDLCYLFQNWQDTSGKVISNTPNYKVELKSDSTLIATYNIESFIAIVGVEPSGVGKITGMSNGFYNCGYSAELFAESTNENYIFEKWNNGSTENPLHLYLSSDTTITAIFKKGGAILDVNDNIKTFYDAASNTIHIQMQFNTIKNVDVLLFNILGIEIATIIPPTNTSDISQTRQTNYLPSGIYYLRINVGGKITYKQFIKQ